MTNFKTLFSAVAIAGAVAFAAAPASAAVIYGPSGAPFLETTPYGDDSQIWYNDPSLNVTPPPAGVVVGPAEVFVKSETNPDEFGDEDGFNVVVPGTGTDPVVRLRFFDFRTNADNVLWKIEDANTGDTITTFEWKTYSASGTQVSPAFVKLAPGDYLFYGQDEPILQGGLPTTYSGYVEVSAVPLPAAVWFLLTGIGGLVGARWLKKDTSVA